MFATLNQCLKGTLPKNIVQSLKNDGHYMAVMTYGRKHTTNPLMLIMGEDEAKENNNMT